MRVRRRTSVVTSGIVAVAVLVAAACGSSSKAAAPAASSSGTTQAATPTKLNGPVTYGVLSCFTGRLASLGQAMIQGAQVAQKAINDAGGILGQQVKLSQADTGCDLADSVPATQNLLSKGVAGIIGPETQEIGAVEPILKNAHIIDEFQGGDTSRDHQSDPYLFRDSPSDSQLGVAMALYAYQKGYRNAALLFYSDVAAQTLIDPVRKTFEKLGGKIVADVTVAPGQTSYQSEVRKVIDAKPDVIFTQTDAPTAAVMFRDFQQVNNLAIPFVGTDVTSGDDYLKAITLPVAHDHLISVYGTSITGQANDAFTSDFNALFPGQQPLANANYAYDAVISLALAEVGAGTVDGAKVAAEMTKVTNPPGQQCFTFPDCAKALQAGTKINYDGASGELNYNQFNNVFGPYGSFQADAKGAEQQVQVMSAADLAKATP